MASINFNYASVTAQRNLGVTQGAFHKAVQRLSSGLRINSGADDAAGLFISEKLKSQIKGLQQASRNAQDGISMIQTAEGALNTVHSLLERMRELAVQAANGIYGTSERSAMQNELRALRDEIGRVADTTSFNGMQLLDGSMVASQTVTNVGAGAGADLSVANGIDGIQAYGVTGTATFDVDIDALVAGPPNTALVTITNNVTLDTQAINVTVPTSGSDTINFAQLGIVVEVNSALGSTAVDPAVDAATFDVTLGATGGIDLQVGANNTTSDRITLNGVHDMDPSTLGIGYNAPVSGNAGAGLDDADLDLSTVALSQTAIDNIDAAIMDVSTVRSNLGAQQTRLEFTVTNLGVAAENQAAANSRVRDADVALEVSNMVKTQILSQSAMAVLAQSNAAPQALLSLLR